MFGAPTIVPEVGSEPYLPRFPYLPLLESHPSPGQGRQAGWSYCTTRSLYSCGVNVTLTIGLPQSGTITANLWKSQVNSTRNFE